MTKFPSIGHKILFRAIVGSHAYGTNVEGSDIDIKGIFIQSPESVLEEGYKPQIEVSKDEVYYELGRFVDLVVGGNPTMLELLYAPSDTVIQFDSILSPLWEHRDKLLSKQLRWSFGGYAIDQIKKAGGLDKKMNWEDERKVRKDVLDFCYITEVYMQDTGYYPQGSFPLKEYLDYYHLEQDEIGLAALDHFRYTYNVFLGPKGKYKGVVQDIEKSNDVSLSEISKGEVRVAILYFNKDGYSVHCKEYNSYLTWLKERNTQRYIDVEGHGQKIDGKNMLHCVRLLETAYQIAKEGKLVVRRPNKDYLISIRKGEVSLEDIIKYSQIMIDNLDELFEKSNLPKKADLEYFKEIVKEIRKENNKKEELNILKKYVPEYLSRIDEELGE